MLSFNFLGALGGEAVSGITEEYMNKLQEEKSHKLSGNSRSS